MKEHVIPSRLASLIHENGKAERYPSGQVFHAQSFNDALFVLRKGYVKRYQVTNEDKHVIELIYGPSNIFPLSQLFRKYFGIEQNQRDLVYVYQAMDDIEIISMPVDAIMDKIEQEPMLYEDLWYESGLRLRANINRLASNALLDDYKKVAHQIYCLVDEFGKQVTIDGLDVVQIQVPLEPTDMAEQLNISVPITKAIMENLSSNNLIRIDGKKISIVDAALLKDVYL